MSADHQTLRAAAERTETALGAHALRIEDVACRPATPDTTELLNAELRAIRPLRYELARVMLGYRSQPRANDRTGTISPGQPFPQTTQEYFEAVNYRLLLSANALAQLDQILSAPPVPLFVLSDPLGMMTAQQRVTDAVFHQLHQALTPEVQDQAAADLGCFADIALPVSLFLANCHAALRVGLAQGRALPLRFLDVGCGSGMKLLLAAEVFGTADGLEYDPGYAAAAVDLLVQARNHGAQIHAGDAMNFGGYGAYDVIYFYRPMSDDAAMAELERRIVASARPGTILVAPYDQFRERAETLGCAAIGGSLHVTGMTPAEADALTAAAETIGTRILVHPLSVDPRAGYTRPLLRACRARGVGIV